MSSALRSLALALVVCACATQRFPDRVLLDKSELDLAARPLSPAESKTLADDGFAILEHGEASSFHVGYTTLFHAHQPVYVTADSLLHAWHSSYDSILTRVERTVLIGELDALVERLRARLGGSGDAQARADLGVYLDVAHDLLHGSSGGGSEATRIVDLCVAAKEPANLTLFGVTDAFDFSMLQPRGHYTLSKELEQYFRAMSWLGRAEVRIAKKEGGRWTVSRRGLRAALLLATLMDSEALTHWHAIDSLLGAFVGPADSLSVPGVTAASRALGEVDQPTDDQIVAAFERPSEQRIRTQMLLGGEATIAVLLLGQRYVADSKVLSDLTYATLPTHPPRMMPTPLDIAATMFRNASARALLEPEVARYGKPYEDALGDISKRPMERGSLHHLWLDALRELSPDPTRDAKLPAPLHGDAWARRMLDAQLASWAELRHDNILYAKQSVTGMILCGYPHGYVDPYPAFYGAMADIANEGLRIAVSAPALRTYFDGMKRTMTRLQAIAMREQQDLPMTGDDLDFLNHMVSVDGRSGGCGGPVLEASGWYADLYFDRSKVLRHEPVIADVHTQPTDEVGNVVGRVLHVATGNPRMLVVRLEHDGGEHATTYRGFVSTYAEKVTSRFDRYTDERWRAEIRAEPPEAPPWMRGIVAQ